MTKLDYPLSQGYGYGFALGIGAGFALLMVMISFTLSRVMGEKQNSERFSTAARSVKSGLIASSTVSAWTWPATLLTSGAWGYAHGISGPFLYGVAGTIQVVLFLFLALEIKRSAPGCHTVAQLFSTRFGKTGHWCYLVYCTATNVLISSLLLLGGSQGFEATTGMHVVAASFLLPLGVCIYTLFGGLKATFLSDWLHTIIIYVIICVAVFTTYAGGSVIGSPGKMWDLLEEVEKTFPSGGSNYLNFKDKDMILLTWTVMLGGLSSVFGDPGYSQRAIASESKSVFYGYLIGGSCWFVVPWGLGSSAGLACRALLNNPISFTYPRELTTDEINKGMPVIYGLYALFGSSGAAAGLVMLFMSVTSATSAELIAFSSISTYDVYQTYINPKASGKQLVNFAHYAVIGFSLFMATIAVIFNYIGVTVGWLISFTGIILTPEIAALVFALFWPKMSTTSLVIGAPLGTLTGIVCWIGATYHYADGVVDRESLMTSEATLIGNITALFGTFVYIFIISLIKPSNFDLSIFATAYEAADDADEKEREAMRTSEADKKVLKRQWTWSIVLNIILLFGVYIILPVSLYGSNYTFTKKFFTSWIAFMIMWLLVSTVYIIFVPLWQGKSAIYVIVMSLFKKNVTEDIPDSKIEDSASDVVKVGAVVNVKETSEEV